MRQRNDSSAKPQSKATQRSNQERRAKASAAIEAKVSELQAIAARHKPLKDGVPTSMRQFRAWADPDLGLVKIGSSATTDPNASPQNARLIQLAYEAMRGIAQLKANSKRRAYVPREKKLEDLRQQVEGLKESNRRLASEVLEYMHLQEVSRRACEQALAERDMALRDLQALRREFLEVSKVGPRRVK